MKADNYSKWNSVKVKARADYLCEKCGSDKMVQAHAPNGDHSDWRNGRCLCAECHSKQHPSMPRDLFFSRTNQLYWPNISARALAQEFNCHNRTVIRRAKTLGIKNDLPLSPEDKERLRKIITNRFPNSPKCAECNSQNIRHRIKSNSFICDHCGHIQPK